MRTVYAMVDADGILHVLLRFLLPCEARPAPAQVSGGWQRPRHANDNKGGYVLDVACAPGPRVSCQQHFS